MPLPAKAPSFTISVERRKEGFITSVNAHDNMLPEDMLEGLIGGLTALYVSAWGSGDVPEDEYLSPEEFSQMIFARMTVKLQDYKIRRATMQ